MLPETLVSCAQLTTSTCVASLARMVITCSYQAQVVLDEVHNPSGTKETRSVPSLMDLLNEKNIDPETVDQAAVEELLFNHPDPYDLAESYTIQKVTKSHILRGVQFHTYHCGFNKYSIAMWAGLR
ncbi:hypothetical protein GGX14DRAFT_391608 [Mycena pura]|uniref:Uncharacterized protein n=1 Tax=Mycena pura TaxID=153505 RepID=A0AAD6VKQ9_9AGAR|nr:hypothetical protein GGX14DRAFT_391608 [Mycena pura]